MGKDEFYCANDLLGREVFVIRRISGFCCEIQGLCTRVVRNVPGDDGAGVIEVEALGWDGEGVQTYRFDLSVWCVENCSALTKEDRKRRDAARMTADPDFARQWAFQPHAVLEPRS